MKQYWASICLLLCLFGHKTFSQSTCPGVITATLLQDQTYRFSFSNPSAIINNDFFWDFGDGEYSKDVSPVHTFSSEACLGGPRTYNVKLIPNSCMELINNGNFERYFSDQDLIDICGYNSNIPSFPKCYETCYPFGFNVFGFYTDHGYRYEWSNSSCGNINTSGTEFTNTFRVNKNSVVTTGYGHNYGDHTLGGTKGQTGNKDGKFLIIDGTDNGPTANTQRILSWVQNISNLEPGQTYKFSCWVKNLTSISNNPMVDFGILTDFDDFGGRYSSFTSMFKAGTTTYAGVTFPPEADLSNGVEVIEDTFHLLESTFVPTTTNLSLAIVSYSAEFVGNDLGIDDISLRKVCGGTACADVPPLALTVGSCIPPCTGCPAIFQPSPHKDYILTAWVKEEGFDMFTPTYTMAGIQLGFSTTGSDVNLPIFYASGPMVEGWQRIEQKFRVPTGSTGVKITLKGRQGGDFYYDDIRIHPVDASMKSFVYDPNTLRLMAELDENNYATFYEYDQEGKRSRLKRETERGIMTIQESSERLFKRE